MTKAFIYLGSMWRRCFVAAAVVLLFSVGALSAHDTWVTPSAYETATGQPVTFALTSGMKFPALEAGPKLERIARAGFRSAREKGDLKDLASDKEALRGKATFTQPGIVTVWLETKPKELELTDDQVIEYLDEIHAPASTREAWSKREKGAKWTETYVKCAKTVVLVGDGGEDKSWSEPVGVPLEMVPLSNPVTLKAGQEFSVRLVQNGKPVPQASIALVPDGDKAHVFQMTDAEGRATFLLPSHGQYLLTCVILEPTSKASIWKSRFATFTFETK